MFSRPTGASVGPQHDLMVEREPAYSCLTRSRRQLVMTLTEDSAMAAAAIMGDISHPKAG